MMDIFVVVCLLLLLLMCAASALHADRHGYILYCPCMGRFGNQADQFLGSLAFARGLNRTLVLPPWVEYDYVRSRTSIQVPFDRYFRVEPLQKYHRVITMEQFMSELASTIWPPGNRTVLCYQPRSGTSGDSCNAKDGNPFGPFWDTFNIDFDRSEYYGPLGFNTDEEFVAKMWHKRFPPSTHLVVAFTGAPAVFPVERQHITLHQYLQWSDYIEDLADSFIHDNIPGRPFLGIHLRNDMDWTNVCKHVAESTRRHLFASAQCLGYSFEFGQITDELCFPSKAMVVNQVKHAVERLGAVAVFVAADRDAMINDFQAVLKPTVKIVRRLPAEPHVDLALLAKADHYIGNCISTFSAFAARERQTAGNSVEFWAFENKTSSMSDEL